MINKAYCLQEYSTYTSTHPEKLLKQQCSVCSSARCFMLLLFKWWRTDDALMRTDCILNIQINSMSGLELQPTDLILNRLMVCQKSKHSLYNHMRQIINYKYSQLRSWNQTSTLWYVSMFIGKTLNQFVNRQKCLFCFSLWVSDFFLDKTRKMLTVLWCSFFIYSDIYRPNNELINQENNH